jgi:thiol-disulfide isomerase/thioredoxin
MKIPSPALRSVSHAALVVALVFGGATARAASTKTPAVGDTFPALAKFGLEGTLPDLSRARVVIVDFWASWCGPCKASFPIYDELHKQYGERGVVIVAINVDTNAKAMTSFLAHQQPGFSVLRDATQKLVQAVAPPTMPTSFLLDARGVVRAVHQGFHGEKTKSEYVEEINRLLAEPS